MYIWAWLANTLYRSSLPFPVPLLSEVRQRNFNASDSHSSVNGPFSGLSFMSSTSPSVPHGTGEVSRRNSPRVIRSFSYLWEPPWPRPPAPAPGAWLLEVLSENQKRKTPSGYRWGKKLLLRWANLFHRAKVFHNPSLTNLPAQTWFILIKGRCFCAAYRGASLAIQDKMVCIYPCFCPRLNVNFSPTQTVCVRPKTHLRPAYSLPRLLAPTPQAGNLLPLRHWNYDFICRSQYRKQPVLVPCKQVGFTCGTLYKWIFRSLTQHIRKSLLVTWVDDTRLKSSRSAAESPIHCGWETGCVITWGP